MFTRSWSTSERKYEVIVHRDVKVRMPDGTQLDGDIFRPDSPEKFPVILGAHAYNKHLQSPPMLPIGFTPMRGFARVFRGAELDMHFSLSKDLIPLKQFLATLRDGGPQRVTTLMERGDY